MYVFRAVLELILAIFAVFGLYSAVRLLMQKLFGDKRIMYAIAFMNKKDTEEAEMLIREAMENFLLTSSCRVAALVAEEFSSDSELISIFRKYGVEYYFI